MLHHNKYDKSKIIFAAKDDFCSNDDGVYDPYILIQSLRKKIEESEKQHKETIKMYEDKLLNASNSEICYQKKIEHLQSLTERFKEKPDYQEKETVEVPEKENKSTAVIEREMIESLIERTAPYIGTHQHIRTLLDLTLFACFSPESAVEMDKLLTSTGFIRRVIDKYTLKNRIPIKKYKHSTDKIVEKIQSYQDMIFNNMFHIKITKHHSVPSYIYCDAIKVEQVLMYLLIDMFNIADKKQPVYIDMMYERKILIFKIKAKKNSAKKQKQSRFKKNTLFKEEHTRVCLDFSKKLAKYMSAEIDNNEHDEGYLHIFRISASDSVIEKIDSLSSLSISHIRA